MNNQKLNNDIFLPQKINVGYQERPDTYTGKLAYIIPFDEKGKLRKEASWNSWRNKEIEPTEFENVPTEGFVLNKNVGGYKSDWNYRQSHIRIFDPRGFEFEIGLENLLYILTNVISTPGKALEGEFVYGWDKKDLILIPVNSPDYKALKKFNDLRHKRKSYKTNDLKLGARYLTKNNEELIYLGKYDHWKNEWLYNEGVSVSKKLGKAFFFSSDPNELKLITVKSLTDYLIDTISDECVDTFSELFAQLESNEEYSYIDETKTIYVPYTLEEFIEQLHEFYEHNWHFDRYYLIDGKTHKKVAIYGNKKRVYDEEKADWKYVLTDLRLESSYNAILYPFEKIFNMFKPVKRHEYLANGTFHKVVKYKWYGDIY